jgi:lipopolysaccharide/colanic/teichoic acid biosynthesis glycosyltransferase
VVKRCFDMIASFCGLLVLSPLLAAVATGIYFTDGPPVLFCQRRVGRRGQGFLLYKFRTMRVPKNSEAGSFDAGNTSRVTRLGRLLRKTKIDELPQLWNVLRGDMSLVGPRPEVERWVAAFPERWAVIHTTRPGITDPASIVYRHEEELLSRAADPEAMYRQEILPRKLSLYETYVRTQTFWGDIHIILRTVAAVLTPHSATEQT